MHKRGDPPWSTRRSERGHTNQSIFYIGWCVVDFKPIRWAMGELSKNQTFPRGGSNLVEYPPSLLDIIIISKIEPSQCLFFACPRFTLGHVQMEINPLNFNHEMRSSRPLSATHQAHHSRTTKAGAGMEKKIAPKPRQVPRAETIRVPHSLSSPLKSTTVSLYARRPL